MYDPIKQNAFLKITILLLNTSSKETFQTWEIWNKVTDEGSGQWIHYTDCSEKGV